MTFEWEHFSAASYTHKDNAKASLAFDSRAKSWVLVIYKEPWVLGDSVRYDVVFREHYAPNRPAAIELAEKILNVEFP